MAAASDVCLTFSQGRPAFFLGSRAGPKGVLWRKRLQTGNDFVLITVPFPQFYRASNAHDFRLAARDVGRL